jgi:hypothetical protein
MHKMVGVGAACGALLCAAAAARAAAQDGASKHLAVKLSATAPTFSCFSVDSLGQGKFGANPALDAANALPGLSLEGHVYTVNGKPAWTVERGEKTLTLRSDYAAGAPAVPFALAFSQKANHATLLGLMKPGERRMALPCLLHLPDMGTLRVTCSAPDAALDYDARRFVKPSFVRIGFPPATVAQARVEYRLEVVSIYPKLPGIEENPLYDGFRRDWLNIFQVNPRLQMLANNASSDPCAFTLFEYSDVALHTPPLAEGLTANDLIRMTLDRYLAGALDYGQVGYGCTPGEADLIAWKTPWTSLDSLPSLLIAACNYVSGSQDEAWARANYGKLSAWCREMLASDKDGNGLLELLHDQGALQPRPRGGGAPHFPPDVAGLRARRVPGLRRERHVARLARLEGRLPRLRGPAGGQLPCAVGGAGRRGCQPLD